MCDATIDYYNVHASDFCTDTVQVNMSRLYAPFLEALSSSKARILDCGCGAGRDTRFFLEQGYVVDAIDASEALCKRASIYTGITVQQRYFQELDVINLYDGIWACASLLHVPAAELPMVLEKLRNALKPDGVLYMSFKLGDFEGMRKGRYFTDWTETSLRAVLAQVPDLAVCKFWKTEDVRVNRSHEKWLNVLAVRQ